ncbi:MAG TPA: transaldolase family protein [Clostridia bacterium]|nr:transaldolase family protein [Clostridia bacterium]
MKYYFPEMEELILSAITVNYLSGGEGVMGVNYALLSLNAPVVPGQEELVARTHSILLRPEDYALLNQSVRAIGVSERFEDVIKTFSVPRGEIPAGFRIESSLKNDGLLMIDLVRDISYDKNGMKRPTGVIFSADSANPYEVAPIAPLLGNLTCNPGIVYDLFINNPKANVGGKFKTREEVMQELGRILGSGVDISVELNNPFEKDFNKILEECEQFKELLSEYRLVVKVPHTGPVNAENVHELLEGDKRFPIRYDEAATADALMGHNLALRLRDHGYRINYTLMFEPYQTALALQAKPYFINSFVRHRQSQTASFKKLLDLYERTGERVYLETIRKEMLQADYLRKNEIERDLLDVYKLAGDIVRYRNADNDEGSDGLDSVRHNLRLLRNNHLRDTRLIICSMEGAYNYPDIDRLMADPAYKDVIDRVVITAEPGYLARFTSTNQVVSYQRRFMNAVNNDNNDKNK